MQLTKMELGEPDASGRRSPRPVSGSEYTKEYDYVISAIGQTQDLSFIGADCNITLERECLAADPVSAMTNIPDVFAAGDVVSGPKTAILAIANGKKAAWSISSYINGVAYIPKPELYNHVRVKDYREIPPESLSKFEKIEKIGMPMLTEDARRHNFNEVELGLSDEQARHEASRCMSCGCADAEDCKLREYAAVYGADQFAFKGEFTKHPIDESHPYIVRDRNKCILCARCVRICVQTGAGVLGFVGRGFETTVEPSFSAPLASDKNCTSCGLCVSTCPTGALVPRSGVTLPTSAYMDSGGKFTSIEDAASQAQKKLSA
jgi:formate dehydrogenase major subunit